MLVRDDVRFFDFDHSTDSASFDGIIKPTPVHVNPDGSAVIMELLRVEFHFGHHQLYTSEYGGTAYLYAGDHSRKFGSVIFPYMEDSLIARLSHFRWASPIAGGGSIGPPVIDANTGGTLSQIDSNHIVDVSDGRGNGVLCAASSMTFLTTSFTNGRPFSCRVYYKPRDVSYEQYVAVANNL